MAWPEFAPELLLNMFISASFGLIFGLIGGWFSHRWAIKRDKENRDWQKVEDERSRAWELILEKRKKLDSLEDEIKANHDWGCYESVRKRLSDDEFVESTWWHRDRLVQEQVLAVRLDEGRLDDVIINPDGQGGEYMASTPENKLIVTTVVLNAEIGLLESDYDLTV